MADQGISTLREITFSRHFRAERGAHGAGGKRHGRRGSDLILRVPVGTLVTVKGNGILADLDQAGQKVKVAGGGRGGFGNARFATSTNQAPRFAEKGERGEENWLILDLKLLADVGIVGLPNVGKSTLLAAVSAAKPKIADYPFTTSEPILGVVEVRNRSFVLADIPGLIEGAHMGVGLGHYFLRHIERTRVLIHLLDGGSVSPLEDLEKVNRELLLFNKVLEGKPQVVVVNKIDLPSVRERMAELKSTFRGVGSPLYFLSAATGEGVSELMAKTIEVLSQLHPQEMATVETSFKVFRPEAEDEKIRVSSRNGIFFVSGAKSERLVQRTDLGNREARLHLRKRLERLGVKRALQKAGISPGAKVRFGEIELEWE